VGRFHAALTDFDTPLQPVGIPLHETDTHIARLREAVRDASEHALHAEVVAIADAIDAVIDDTASPEGLPSRVIHGDLKFNNILFAGSEGADAARAVAIIDLDTLSRLPLWAELGDAWRSWCNRAGEDQPEAAFDIALFRAAAEGWLEEAPPIDTRERTSLVLGPERIALELASRFAADALRESYFGWDPERFETRGHHNHVRARGQLDLYRQLRAARPVRTRILGL
jgi:Ser/Thr protein kinase RdoA (MazF antagonist)